ncbi:hypothetical protein [Caenispirillum salinarum]|uniref:hypothetical protein n=1 Tax=Caenispirillum salinarum TaxID=859058 RepID=UPI0038514757
MTPCPRPIRRLGYLHDLIAVRARHRRCRDAWAPHLAATRERVAAAAEAAPGRDLAVVLGAGLLLDVPLDVLAAAFRRVVLVDVCWLGETRRAVRRFGNVDLLDHDVTGLAAACQDTTSIPAVPRGSIPYLRDADLVCSLNCLSQLPLNPRLALESLPGVSADRLDRFSRAVVAAHVEALADAPGLALLVADTTAERVLKSTGDALSRDLLFGHPHPDGGDTWWWDIAPAPEEDRRYDLRHKVVAGLV